jgi:hypothetical protein
VKAKVIVYHKDRDLTPVAKFLFKNEEGLPQSDFIARALKTAYRRTRHRQWPKSVKRIREASRPTAFGDLLSLHIDNTLAVYEIGSDGSFDAV